MAIQTQQQFDPMAQLMQLLAYQQRNKQLRQQGELGGRELDLREQQLRQMGDQFTTGLSWEKERAGMQNQQWEQEQALRSAQQQMEQSRFDQENPLKQDFLRAQIEQMTRVPTAENDPRMAIMHSEEQNQLLNYLQNQIMIAQTPVQAEQYRQQLDAYIKQRFGSQLPPLPPMTIEQQKLLKSTQQR